MEITLLSGAVLDVRKWKLAEMEMLLGTNTRTFLSTLLKVFEKTTLSVVDPGIYDPFSWGKVYEGDLYDALWQFRAMSVSPNYGFQLQCPNKRCKAKIEFDMPVADVRRNPLKPDIRAELAAGNNKITRPWSRGTFTFLIPTADQAVAMMNANRGTSTMRQKGDAGPVVEEETKMTAMLKTKLLRLTEGDVEYEASSLRNWIDDIDLPDAGELFGLLEDSTFGVDSAMEVTCGECGAQWEGEVPMTRSFFLPKKTRP